MVADKIYSIIVHAVFDMNIYDTRQQQKNKFHSLTCFSLLGEDNMVGAKQTVLYLERHMTMTTTVG